MVNAAGPKGKIVVEPIKSEADLRQALAIREVVFIEEQNVPADIEHDDDDVRAFHVLAYDRGHAIGTGRLIEMSPASESEGGRWGRIGRMAVLQSHRKQGVGRRILDVLEAEARCRKLGGIVLHAQVHVHDFYVKAGYADIGPIFEEAGMPHVQMRKRLAEPEGLGGGNHRRPPNARGHRVEPVTRRRGARRR